jgi:protease-4
VFHWAHAIHGDRLARVTIRGEIDEDPALEDLLGSVADDDEIKALIVHIDSPGGTTTGSEMIYRSLRDVAANKPVVATLGTVAASGGYIAALAADHIVAHETTTTGSIGVIFEVTDVHKLMDIVGVRMDAVKSAPLKGEPSGYTAMDDKTRRAVQALVDDTYRWFLDLVVERRGLTIERARELGDGRVYTGRQAADLKLVDELGGEQEAVDWLSDARGIDPDLKIEDLSLEQPTPWYDVSIGRAAAGVFREVLDRKSSFLDGVKAVWHPRSSPAS